MLDASGVVVSLSAPPRRIVSLIPSITEILFALGVGEAVAGCTIFCTEPRDGVTGKTKVGGEKNPKLELIRELGADLVIANIEENLREHVETLRAWGIAVYVTYPRTVAAGIGLVAELGALTGAEDEGRRIAQDLGRRLDGVRVRGQGRAPARDTYIDDMLSLCGGANIFAGLPQRYPEVTLEAVAGARPEVILLPDEPYHFRQVHVKDFSAYPEMPAVRDGRIHLMDGKLLSWYGPRIARALDVLPDLLGPGVGERD